MNRQWATTGGQSEPLRSHSRLMKMPMKSDTPAYDAPLASNTVASAASREW